MPPKSTASLKSHGRARCNRDVKRSASATALHPLTRQHNQHFARSTGSFFDQVDEVRFEGVGCRCRVCRSPRGAWRKDSLGSQIMGQLERLKPSDDDADVEVPNPSASPKRRVNKTRPTDDDDDDVLMASLFDTRLCLARPTRTGAAQTKKTLAESDHILDDETLALLHQTAGEGNGKRPLRPSSAPAGRQQDQKAQRELRTEAAQERKRQLHEGYVQRCRAAWDAKMAVCESRQKEVAANALAIVEAKKFANKAQADANERARKWITIMKIVAVSHYFQELAISDRISQFASFGGKSMQQALKWRQIPLKHESRLGAAQMKPKVWQKLRAAYMISSIFPSVGCLCLKGPMETEDIEAVYRLERIHEKSRNWRLWSVVCYCAMAITRLKLRTKLRAGRTIAIVLTQMAITNTIYLSFRNRFFQIRQLQMAIRNWIQREKLRRARICALLERIEDETLKRSWADDDLRAIREEKRRLAKLRTVTERKLSERVISLAKEKNRQYMKPKNEFEFADLNQLLEKHRVPTCVLNLCTYNVYIQRKVFIKRKLDDQAKKQEAYERERQCWRDIDDAVRIFDPSFCNPDPLPEPPLRLAPFHFTIQEGVATSIVVNLHIWCRNNPDIVEESKAEVCKGSIRSLDFFKSKDIMKRLPWNLAQINIAVRGIVKSAVFS